MLSRRFSQEPNLSQVAAAAIPSSRRLTAPLLLLAWAMLVLTAANRLQAAEPNPLQMADSLVIEMNELAVLDEGNRIDMDSSLDPARRGLHGSGEGLRASHLQPRVVTQSAPSPAIVSRLAP